MLTKTSSHVRRVIADLDPDEQTRPAFHREDGELRRCISQS
jgi:hypothetical protein